MSKIVIFALIGKLSCIILPIKRTSFRFLQWMKKVGNNLDLLPTLYHIYTQ